MNLSVDKKYASTYKIILENYHLENLDYGIIEEKTFLNRSLKHQEFKYVKKCRKDTIARVKNNQTRDYATYTQLEGLDLIKILIKKRDKKIVNKMLNNK